MLLGDTAPSSGCGAHLKLRHGRRLTVHLSQTSCGGELVTPDLEATNGDGLVPGAETCSRTFVDQKRVYATRSKKQARVRVCPVPPTGPAPISAERERFDRELAICK